jgi:uroporphyrinogen-III synthase
MTDAALAGVGVLVTRPTQQSAGLVAAIEAAGGKGIAFPVIEIVPRSPQDIEADINALNEPDIVIYVSGNAVEHGLAWNSEGAVAAVGPATAAAIEAAARIVDIRPADGYDSEHLLAEPALTDVRGKTVRIVRGNSGRELLADTLRERGATVDYLPVYDRRMPAHSAADVATLAGHWQAGDIDVATVMSVESLRNLITLVPDSCSKALAKTPLVTPAARVLKEAQEQLPGCPVHLATGPGADEMVSAIAAIPALGQHNSGQNS